MIHQDNKGIHGNATQPAGQRSRVVNSAYKKIRIELIPNPPNRFPNSLLRFGNALETRIIRVGSLTYPVGSGQHKCGVFPEQRESEVRLEVLKGAGSMSLLNVSMKHSKIKIVFLRCSRNEWYGRFHAHFSYVKTCVKRLNRKSVDPCNLRKLGFLR